jgi:hypothetical protein
MRSLSLRQRSEPDDQMSLLQPLLNSSDIDIEGFGATTGWQRAKTRTAPRQAHLILAGGDHGQPILTRYRRIILEIAP